MSWMFLIISLICYPGDRRDNKALVSAPRYCHQDMLQVIAKAFYLFDGRSFQRKAEHTAAALHLSVCKRGLLKVGAKWPNHLIDRGMFVKPFGNLCSGFKAALHAQWQRTQAADKQPGRMR